MSADAKKPQISERVSQMKFMKRKEEASLRSKLERDREAEEEAARWSVRTDVSGRLIVGDDDDEFGGSGSGASSSSSSSSGSAASVFGRAPGRRSFGGFNSNIEKIIEEAKLSTAQLVRSSRQSFNLPSNAVSVLFFCGTIF
jgi:hypothetical protein